MSETPLRIHIHDWCGHTFQAQLSRELARRGLVVEHSYSSEYVGGKGRLELEPGDPETLSFTTVTAARPFEKYSPVGRLRYELSYADAWISRLNETRPDVVVICNTPLLTAERFRSWARRTQTPWVLWHQDIISLALGEELHRKLPNPIAQLGARTLSWLERRIVQSATRVVAIGDEFRRHYDRDWKLRRPGVSVIPNWAPLNEITPRPLDNPWSADWVTERGDVTLIYAGTLGRKHNPGLLVDLIKAVQERGVDARLVVASEGEGAEVIRTRMGEVPVAAIRVIDFQPAEQLSDMLSSGDILVAILEPGASKFSIPSKVLSYLAAGRPVLGLMPADNPAANDIVAAGGLVAPPTPQGIAQAAEWVAAIGDDGAVRAELGQRSRKLAEDKFDISHITDQFAKTLSAAAKEA
ncbi:glycosyltransferase family 4 protein [Mycobacterium sp. RTGN5]|uniref:glycosyltransferase family 4 protein n=1 Tax=Mycobacterium sp. RTGN5 TaxID=3016522 RepID=UPI0029C6B32D|nr:glycosyltransferase family 4 protein [Mycobacterium sp. RTGN5]